MRNDLARLVGARLVCAIEVEQPIHYVQQQCGHHSPAFTLATYGHLFPQDQHSNVDVLDDAQTLSAAQPDAHRRNHSKKQRAA